MSKIMFRSEWIFYFAFLLLVDGHSILRTPTAWNTRESKSRPCGNGAMPTTAVTGANKVPGGATVSGMWEVTAGDGNGPVTITLAKTDAEVNSFSGDTIPINMNPVPQRGTGQYPFTFVAPAPGTCTGGADGKSCHLQFKSTSNWYSCMTLSLEAPATGAPTGAPTITPRTPFPTASPTVVAPSPSPTTTPYVCTTIPQITGYCAGLSGKNVAASLGADTIVQALQRIEREANANRLNPIVFRNGQSPNCITAFEKYWCSRSLPLCTENKITTQCKSLCLAAMSECDLDPLHAQTFSCDRLTTTVTDVYGTCPATVPVRQINLKSRYVGIDTDIWRIPPAGKSYIDMKLYEGDKLTFKYSNAESDVYKFITQTDYENCNFASAQLQDFANGITEWSYVGESAVGAKLFFGSKIPANACQQGQKVRIDIVGFPLNSVQIAVYGEPEVVTPVPTQSPRVYSPTLNSLPNSSISIAPFLVSIFCCFLIAISH